MQKICHTNNNQELGMALLISDEIELSQNLLKPENIGHRYKGPYVKFGMTIINIHATNNEVPQCMMQN